MAAAAAFQSIRRQRRIAIRDRLVKLFKDIEPTPLSAEGPARHGLRRQLCLAGWCWGNADDEAALIVRSALQLTGAKRPSWLEGQREYVQPGVLPILRERCAQCGKTLPEGHFKFCSNVCGRSYRLKEVERQRGFEEEIARESGKVIRTSNCEQCGRLFMQKRRDQRFCDRKCVDDSLRRQVPSLCERVRG